MKALFAPVRSAEKATHEAMTTEQITTACFEKDSQMVRLAPDERK